MPGKIRDMSSSQRKRGIASRNRRRVNLTRRNTAARPPLHSRRKSLKIAHERTIRGRTIPEIALLKKNTKGFDAFFDNLSNSEQLNVMELDMFGELNLD